MTNKRLIMCALLLAVGTSSPASGQIPILLDTDANNELDDQHAIAYLLFNGPTFNTVGITVNRTRFGGDIHEQAAEAERVVALCGLTGKIPVLKGASEGFEQIQPELGNDTYDGEEAVSFIIDAAHRYGTPERKLVLAPIGKLTNIALALAKDPSIAPLVRIVWLGSNYPEPGEYNLDNDIPAVNYVLDTAVDFEMAVVRYGESTGTAAVSATLDEIRAQMPGKGVQVKSPIPGRNGGEFTTFGDYSLNLFENINLEGDPPSRALYDMAALAIIKNPAWAARIEVPASRLVDERWQEHPDNSRRIVVWEQFDRDGIMTDFYRTMDHPQPARL